MEFCGRAESSKSSGKSFNEVSTIDLSCANNKFQGPVVQSIDHKHMLQSYFRHFPFSSQEDVEPIWLRITVAFLETLQLFMRIPMFRWGLNIGAIPRHTSVDPILSPFEVDFGPQI
ncbi:MAG: hypothetical protein DWQ01_03050 [Planctomycetota bacterium]|nr:MAG: hypothetical protein DWQ01_03050 [Planctomycetota bacterium]